MRRFLNAIAAIVLLAVAACAPGIDGQAGPLPGPSPDTTPYSSNRRLVVLMVTDDTDHQHTGAESIARGVTRNADLMAGFFNDIRVGAGMDVEIHAIAGSPPPNDPFNCAKIVESIKDLPVQAGDAVMIYYAGHGFNIGTDHPDETRAYLHSVAPRDFPDGPLTAFPFLACGTQLVGAPNLDMIAAWLAPKKPALTLVMADACNSYIGATGPAAEEYFVTAAPAVVPEARLRSLFRDARGTVLMTGSQTGHYSYYVTDPKYQVGGVFTLRFLDTIRRMPLNVATNWDDVGRQLGSQNIMEMSGKMDTQTPMLRVGAPFETAVKLQAAAVTPGNAATVEVAQAVSATTDAPRLGSASAPKVRPLRHEQIAPGSQTGTDPGPAPVPYAPRSLSVSPAKRLGGVASRRGTLH